MGSLAGHVIPGVFFIIHGALWCLNAICYCLKSKSSHKSSKESRSRKSKLSRSASSLFFEIKHDQSISSKSWIPLSFTRIPIEPILKILFPSLGLLVESFLTYKSDSDGRHVVFETYRVWKDNGEISGMGKLHHITMYAAFMLSGIMDMATLCVRLPQQTSMIFFSLAFTVEGLLFYLHTMGRVALNVEVHVLLFYAILSCMIFSVLRIFTATNLVVNLGLGSSILLQGTWLVQGGYLLYGKFFPGYNEADMKTDRHKESLFVVACFTWHILFVSLYNVVSWIILSVLLKIPLLRWRQRSSPKRSGLLAKLWQRHQDQSAESEERDDLIVPEEGEENEMEVPSKGIEMPLIAETHT